MSDVDLKFKIIVAGKESVGKTSLIRRYVDEKFNESYIPTLLTDFSTKDVNYKGKKVRLLLYELAGHEKYRGMQSRHFKLANYICIVASFNDKESLQLLPQILKWSNETWHSTNDGYYIPTTVVLNKVDLVKEQQNAEIMLYKYKTTVKKLTKGYATNGFLFTSAKTGEGVDVLFHKIAHILCKV